MDQRNTNSPTAKEYRILYTKNRFIESYHEIVLIIGYV